MAKICVRENFEHFSANSNMNLFHQHRATWNLNDFHFILLSITHFFFFCVRLPRSASFTCSLARALTQHSQLLTAACNARRRAWGYCTHWSTSLCQKWADDVRLQKKKFNSWHWTNSLFLSFAVFRFYYYCVRFVFVFAAFTAVFDNDPVQCE